MASRVSAERSTVSLILHIGPFLAFVCDIGISPPVRQSVCFSWSEAIRTPSGAEVPLLDVADVEKDEAFTSINRRDGRRVINVSLDIEPKRAVTQVIEALRNEELPKLREDFPGITWSFEGSDVEMRRATSSLWGSFGLALAVVYSLLAIAFRGYILAGRIAPIPANFAHDADDLWRSHAAHLRKILASSIHHSDGHLVGLRNSFCHGHHPGACSLPLPYP
jgi:hypothetical protein